MFIKQLQNMASACLGHMGAPELRRAAAMIGVMECAVDVAGCAPNMLREEGSSGEWRGGAWVELMVALRGAWDGA